MSYLDHFMDLDDVVAAIRRCAVKNPPFPMTMRIDQEWPKIRLTIVTRVPCRDSGEIITVCHPRIFHVADYRDSRQVMHTCPRGIEHEFRECWHEDGVRTLDPHASERTHGQEDDRH